MSSSIRRVSRPWHLVAVVALASIAANVQAAAPKADDGEAGFRALSGSMQVLAPEDHPNSGSLVASYAGRNAKLKPILLLAHRMWPEARVVPAMSTEATDGRCLNAAGIPTYGVSGIFAGAAGSGAHGLNERVPVQPLLDGRHFLQQLVTSYTRR